MAKLKCLPSRDQADAIASSMLILDSLTRFATQIIESSRETEETAGLQRMPIAAVTALHRAVLAVRQRTDTDHEWREEYLLVSNRLVDMLDLSKF